MTHEMQQLVNEIEQRLKQLKVVMEQHAQKEKRTRQRESLIQACVELGDMYTNEDQVILVLFSGS